MAKKKIKDLALKELFINCVKYHDCCECPFIDMPFNCGSFKDIFLKIDLEKEVEVKK